jgi:glycosyltransferase involved in cell wall biosynthesis
MKLSLPQSISLIQTSTLFDEAWYLEKFPDVVLTDMSAAEHYLRIGWRLGRNPGPDFSTKNYITENFGMLETRICPLIHHENTNASHTIVAESKAHFSASGKATGKHSNLTPQKNDDIFIVEQSRLFDADWYLANYPEVGESGLGAAEHYLFQGTKSLLNPGPGFSTRFYLHTHPDIRNADIHPLVHYEKYGRGEGRAILPAYLDSADTDPAVLASTKQDQQKIWTDAQAARRHLTRILGAGMPGEPVRMYQSFDTAQTERFIAALEACVEQEVGEQPLVTVIMPTYNRGLKIAAAIDSVLQQSWLNFELLIVDDGSTDNTSEILAAYDDKRVKVLHSNHGGVSVARNEGLHHARGEVIFYLDSDNEWTKDFLWIMMESMRHSGASCGYAATRLQSPSGYLIGYRGEPFNWEACLALNYVDMNVFCHRREVSERSGAFDAGLRRMVDWDLILRYTRNERVFYAPVIGCIYLEDSFDMERITTSQPIVSRKLVHDKNALGCTLLEAVAGLSFNIAIKTFAPFQDRNAWGDYHYAESLAEALEKRGHRVRIDFRGQWYDKPVSTDDVAIVLRGLEPYNPRPTQINIFWGISHPDTVPPKEYDGYQGVFIASRSYAEMMEILLCRKVQTMWQCTDASRFSPPSDAVADVNDPLVLEKGIFIGNSRREYRQIVRWAVETGLPLDVIGQDWEEYLPKETIRATNAPNKELAALYGSASFVLNDHWASMRDFGYVSNRVFDVLAAGGQLISDKVASIDALFGDAVISVSSAEELRTMVSEGAMNRDKTERHRLSDAVRQHHSFTQRAETFDRWIRAYLAPGFDPEPESKGESNGFLADRWEQRTRVGLLAAWSDPNMLNVAIERLVAPLTSDFAATQLQVLRIETDDDLRKADIDVLLIAGNSCRWNTALYTIVASQLEQGIPVFLDMVSASMFDGMGSLVPKLAGLWCDGDATRRHWPQESALVVPSTLDPRLWHFYRTPRPIEVEAGMTRLVIICGLGAEAPNQANIRALLDIDQPPNGISLQVIGMDQTELPLRPWLRCKPWPKDCVGYAHRARWLLDNIVADAGIVFGEAANSDGQMLHMMALGLVPVVITPAPHSLAESDMLTDIVAVCETGSDLAGALQRVAASPAQLLAKRRANFEHLWQNHSTVIAPDPRISAIVAAAQVFRTGAPA